MHPQGPSHPRARVTHLHGQSHPSLNQPGLHTPRDQPGSWAPSGSAPHRPACSPQSTQGSFSERPPGFPPVLLLLRAPLPRGLRHTPAQSTPTPHLPSGCTSASLKGGCTHIHCHQDHPADTAFSGPGIPQTHSHMLTAIRITPRTRPSLGLTSPGHAHCHQDYPTDTAFSGPDIPRTRSLPSGSPHGHGLLWTWHPPDTLTAIRVILQTRPSLDLASPRHTHTCSLPSGSPHGHSLPLAWHPPDILTHTHCHQDHPADTAFSGLTRSLWSLRMTLWCPDTAPLQAPTTPLQASPTWAGPGRPGQILMGPEFSIPAPG